MTHASRLRNRIVTALAVGATFATLAACGGSDGSVERGTSAGAAAAHASAGSDSSTPSPSTTSTTSTTTSTTSAPSTSTTTSTTTTAASQAPPSTGAPTTSAAPPVAPPPSTPADEAPAAAIEDFSLELVGTTNECAFLTAPCWYVRASWRGEPAQFNLTPGVLSLGVNAVSSLPLGPAPYPKEAGRFVVQFVMKPNQHDCPRLWAVRAIYDPASRGYTSEPIAGPIVACIDTPAIPG